MFFIVIQAISIKNGHVWYQISLYCKGIINNIILYYINFV